MFWNIIISLTLLSSRINYLGLRRSCPSCPRSRGTTINDGVCVLLCSRIPSKPRAHQAARKKERSCRTHFSKAFMGKTPRENNIYDENMERCCHNTCVVSWCKRALLSLAHDRLWDRVFDINLWISCMRLGTYCLACVLVSAGWVSDGLVKTFTLSWSFIVRQSRGTGWSKGEGKRHAQMLRQCSQRIMIKLSLMRIYYGYSECVLGHIIVINSISRSQVLIRLCEIRTLDTLLISSKISL